jgi:hypothetical protein
VVHYRSGDVKVQLNGRDFPRFEVRNTALAINALRSVLRFFGVDVVRVVMFGLSGSGSVAM